MADSLDNAVNEAFKDDEAEFVAPPKAAAFKFSQPGDFIKGSFVGSKPFQGDYEPTTIWTVKAEKGAFHADEAAGEATALTPGLEYGVFDHYTFHDEMTQAQVGQRLILTFKEWKASTQRKGKKYKVIECRLDPKFVKPEVPPFDPMA